MIISNLSLLAVIFTDSVPPDPVSLLTLRKYKDRTTPLAKAILPKQRPLARAKVSILSYPQPTAIRRRSSGTFPPQIAPPRPSKNLRRAAIITFRKNKGQNATKNRPHTPGKTAPKNFLRDITHIPSFAISIANF